jgi:hypothetical protein
VHHGIAALLVIGGLGGCAQVLGLEEWKPQTSVCSECLFSTQTTCEIERKACTADMTCEPVHACSQECAGEADPLTCIKGCCETANGNKPFGTFLTCICAECEEACGAQSLECPMYCATP